MKKVLITGGCGFIGSNFVDYLIRHSYDPKDITVIDNLSSESSTLDYLPEGVNYMIADVREMDLHMDCSFDYIFHFAANARIQPSFNQPYGTLINNIHSTAAVLEYARKNNVGKVIYAGSSSYYNGSKKSPYSFSKRVGEELCELYHRTYGVLTVITRFFNVYGPRQPFIGPSGTVIGIFENQCKAGENLTIIGDGSMRRDFTHVNDICAGLLLLAHHDVYGMYNLGTGKNYSLNEIADKIISLSHNKIGKKYLPERKEEAHYTLAEIGRAIADVGYRPRHDLMEYLEDTIPAYLYPKA